MFRSRRAAAERVLAGQTCNTSIIIDFSKYMHRILSIDAERRLAVVEPGCILDHLRSEADKHGLTFGPDPATHDHNTLGGMIGNNSCGVHSVMAGRTADNVQSLDILTYDGLRMTVGPTGPAELSNLLASGGKRADLYRRMQAFWRKHGKHFEEVYPQIPRRVSGYENLDQLSPEKGMNVARALVGTEATCVIVLAATLNLIPNPHERALAIVGFPDVFGAADAVPDVLETKPIGLEGIDHMLVEYMKKKHFKLSDLEVLPDGRAWLVAEFGGDTVDAAAAMASALIDKMRPKGHACNLVKDKAKQQEVWDVRDAALAVTAHIPGESATWPGWEDSAVRPDDLGRYLRELKALFHKHGYDASVYGHFGDGLVHCRINFDLSSEEGLKNWQAFLDEAADLVVKYGGSISGEHGDGEARGALLERMYGPDLMAAQREFRAIWDPRQRMNLARFSIPIRSPPTSASVPPIGRGRSRVCSPIPRTAAVSPKRLCAAWGSGNAAAVRRRAASCARAIWAPTKRSIRHAAEPDCCSKWCAATCSRTGLPTRRWRRRSTSVSPARAANTIARSKPTWRPTRPSSGRGITRASGARAPPTAWDRSRVGPGTRPMRRGSPISR